MKVSQSVVKFNALHHGKEPLLLGNVWDAHTAKLAEKAGFKALGSSSHAIALALGYEDGQNISFEELLFVVKRITAVVKIPVSVDFEAGYSDNPQQVAEYARKLAAAGVSGINLEDGLVKNGKRQLEDAEALVAKIKAIKAATGIFINARADTYTTKHADALEESVRRAQQYEKAGADGIFLPLIETESDIRHFLSSVKLPLNVFTTPKLPDYGRLAELGVKRVSHGGKQYDQLLKVSEGIFTDFFKTKDYKLVLGA